MLAHTISSHDATLAEQTTAMREVVSSSATLVVVTWRRVLGNAVTTGKDNVHDDPRNLLTTLKKNHQ